MCGHAKEIGILERCTPLTNSGLNSRLFKAKYLFANLLDFKKLSSWELDLAQLESLLKHILKLDPASGLTPAGYTYLGQLLTHEIVPDNNFERAKNSRRGYAATPFLNLDSIYFRDETLSKEPDLMAGGYFIIREIANTKCFDLDRECDGEARIPEPRNDDNVIVAQLLVKVMEFHNAIMDTLSEGTTVQRYKACKAFVTLVLQRIFVEDYMQKILHPRVYESYFIQGRKAFYCNADKRKFNIPLEYSNAAFRFGHSMVRPSYVLNKDEAGKKRVFNLDQILNSGKKIGIDKKIDWNMFFPLGMFDSQSAIKINVNLTSTFVDPQKDRFDLLGEGLGYKRSKSEFSAKALIAYQDVFRSIAFSDLIASQSVPSPKDIVDSLNDAGDHPIGEIYDALNLPNKGKHFLELMDFDKDFKAKVKISPKFNIGNSPLWLFFLREAEVFPLTESTRVAQSKAASNDLNQPSRSSTAQDCTLSSEDDSVVIKIEQPASDQQRLGPIASIVIAETIKTSIAGSSVNIYKPWGEIKRELGIELSDFYAELLSEEKFLTFEYLIKFVTAKH
jgi:hypothetical protein